MKITLPSHLGTFISNCSKMFMNSFIRKHNGFYNHSVLYGNTDSLYIERKHWNVLNKTKLLGGNLCPGENDYGDDKIIFHGLFSAP